jgi:hypothetical protein
MILFHEISLRQIQTLRDGATLDMLHDIQYIVILV